jgi:hypothetical protein
MPWSDTYGYKFTLDSLSTYAPDEPGVFGLFNESGWVFIGKTVNLRHGLNTCLAQKSRFWHDNEPVGFTFEACAIAETDALRDQLTLEYTPYLPPVLPDVPKKTVA